MKNTVESLHKAQVEFDLENEAKIIIQTKYINKSVHVELIDTGIGIPEDEIDKIWNVGYSKRDIVDSIGGLGLSVVKRIVEEHEGTIRVFNNPNKGVTFYMIFPKLNQSLNLSASKNCQNTAIK